MRITDSLKPGLIILRLEHDGDRALRSGSLKAFHAIVIFIKVVEGNDRLRLVRIIRIVSLAVLKTADFNFTLDRVNIMDRVRDPIIRIFIRDNRTGQACCRHIKGNRPGDILSGDLRRFLLNRYRIFAGAYRSLARAFMSVIIRHAVRHCCVRDPAGHIHITRVCDDVFIRVVRICVRDRVGPRCRGRCVYSQFAPGNRVGIDLRLSVQNCHGDARSGILHDILRTRGNGIRNHYARDILQLLCVDRDRPGQRLCVALTGGRAGRFAERVVIDLVFEIIFHFLVGNTLRFNSGSVRSLRNRTLAGELTEIDVRGIIDCNRVTVVHLGNGRLETVRADRRRFIGGRSGHNDSVDTAEIKRCAGDRVRHHNIIIYTD